MRENTEQKKPPYLDTFRAVYFIFRDIIFCIEEQLFCKGTFVIGENDQFFGMFFFQYFSLPEFYSNLCWFSEIPRYARIFLDILSGINCPF